MPKIMIFVDGTWLYRSLPRLGAIYGSGQQGHARFDLNYGALPTVLAKEIELKKRGGDYDIVRSYLFGSYATNFDARDEDAVKRRMDFFYLLKEEFGYELELFGVDFHGRRLRRQDRDPADEFEPRETGVEVSLATTLLYSAALNAYDIGVVVTGDRDFVPALRHVRLMGKRVAIASITENCAYELYDPRDESRVRDFDVIWIDGVLDQLELRQERKKLICQSEIHPPSVSREVWTTYRLRKGERFYCPSCKEAYRKQKLEAEIESAVSGVETLDARSVPIPAVTLDGYIIRKIKEKGIAFARTDAGEHYFLHVTDLEPELPFEQVEVGLPITFEVESRPTKDRAGTVYRVRPSR